jgi:transposase-like protein
MTISIKDLLSQNQLDHFVIEFLKEKLEFLLKEEIKHFTKVERPDEGLQRNGYYKRDLDTKHGKIKDLAIPRDRQEEFKTQLFEPYQRRDGWLEEAVIRMYQSGVSTRDIGKMVAKLVGSSYSAATVSKNNRCHDQRC